MIEYKKALEVSSQCDIIGVVKMARSLAILMMLGAGCLLAISCQTAGTPPQSRTAAQTKAAPPSAKAAALPQASPGSSRTAAVPKAPPSARSAIQNGTARHPGGVTPAIPAQFKKFISGTANMLGELYDTVAGPRTGPAGAIEYAVAAAIVIALGATAILLLRRHRKLTPSPR
jgi:hypothetical protein